MRGGCVDGVLGLADRCGWLSTVNQSDVSGPSCLADHCWAGRNELSVVYDRLQRPSRQCTGRWRHLTGAGSEQVAGSSQLGILGGGGASGLAHSHDDLAAMRRDRWQQWGTTNGCRIVDGHRERIQGLCAGTMNRREVVATGDDSGLILMHDLRTGRMVGRPIIDPACPILALAWIGAFKGKDGNAAPALVSATETGPRSGIQCWGRWPVTASISTPCRPWPLGNCTESP